MKRSLNNLWIHPTNNRLFALCAKSHGKQSVMVASWLMQASLQSSDQRFVLALSKKNFTTGVIIEAGQFSINALRSDQSSIAVLCGLKSGRDVDKFSLLNELSFYTGIPYLPNSAAYGFAKVVSQIDTGDRLVVYSKLEHNRVMSEDYLIEENFFESLTPELSEAFKKKRIEDEAFERDTHL